MTKQTHRGREGSLSFSPQAVQVFLQSHPDFFEKHPDVLKNLSVPHGHRGAVSLIEKQVKVLQEENRCLKQEITTWAAHAKENEELLLAIKTLTLKLMKVDSLEEFVEQLEANLMKDFAIDAVAFKLNQRTADSCPQALESRLIKEENLDSVSFSGVVSASTISPADMQSLFGGKSAAIFSTAQLPLGGLGILVLGSQKEKHFLEDDGTLFLSFIQDVVNSILPIFIELPH